MNDDSLQHWLWTAPLPDAIEAVITELHTPFSAMQGTLLAIQDHTYRTTCQEFARSMAHHVTHLMEQLNRLFELKHLIASCHPHSEKPHTALAGQATDVLNDIIVGLQVVLNALQTASQYFQAECFSSLEANIQALFQVFESNLSVLATTVDTLLRSIVFQRLEAM